MKNDIINTNEWETLKIFTEARIALGRTGVSIPTNKLLEFTSAHAQAKDAVYSEMDTTNLLHQIEEVAALNCVLLESQARDRTEYLKRPDLGRKLSLQSKDILTKTPNLVASDIVLVVADGLSAKAINTYAFDFVDRFVKKLKAAGNTHSPVCLVKQGRVAIGDEIATLLKARTVAVIIGERPGLSSADSMGIYFTYNPYPGITDEKRNCISNIREKGTSIELAAQKLFLFLQTSLKLGISGVNLKEDWLLLE